MGRHYLRDLKTLCYAVSHLMRTSTELTSRKLARFRSQAGRCIVRPSDQLPGPIGVPKHASHLRVVGAVGCADRSETQAGESYMQM